MGVSLSFHHMGDLDWQQVLFPTEPTHHPTPPHPPQSFLLINSICFLAESLLVASQLIPSRGLEAWHWTLTYKALRTQLLTVLLPAPAFPAPQLTSSSYSGLLPGMSQAHSYPKTFVLSSLYLELSHSGLCGAGILILSSGLRSPCQRDVRCALTTATQSCACNCIFL